MSDRVDLNGQALPDGDRLSRTGKVIRSLSLDELPQLWNVLLGHMSFVGPRPLLMEYLERYTLEQLRRHAVLPGITGWAQVTGRNSLTWEQRFDLDLWYVDHWSLKLDFYILLRTVISVCRRDGIAQSGHVTMPKFRGSSKK